MYAEHEINVGKVQLQIKRTQTQMAKDCDEWRRYAIDLLFTMATTFYTTQLVNVAHFWSFLGTENTHPLTTSLQGAVDRPSRNRVSDVLHLGKVFACDS